MKSITLLLNNILYSTIKNGLFLIVLMCVNFLVSQNQQLELEITNDKLVFLDKYYTNGIHVTYRRGLQEDFLFSKKTDNALQLNITLGNETYTPKNLNSFNNQNFDRPYAGWLFFNFEVGKINKKSALFVALETGVTGKESLAGKLQTKVHELLNIDSRPTWADEIAFKWLFNVKMLQVQEFRLNKNNSIQNQISASVGNKDVLIGNEVYYYIGKLNNFQSSSRLDLISDRASRECFGFVSAGYRYVMLNSLIQGSPFNNKDPFTTVAAKSVFNLSAGVVRKINRNTFKLIYYYNSKETPLSGDHSYGSLSYGLSF